MATSNIFLIYLRQVPETDSVIVLAVKKRHASALETSVPLEEKSQRLDAVGRKVCDSADVAFKTANAAMFLEMYERALWLSLTIFADDPPMEGENIS